MRIGYWILPALLLVSGCAGLHVPQDEPPAGAEAAACARFFDGLDTTITQADVRDAQAARIPGFPYLRVNRFLASFAAEPLNDAVFHAWAGRMRALAEQGWEMEWRNLPEAAQRRFYQAAVAQGKLHDGDDMLSAVRMCGVLLQYAQLQHARARERLRDTARVPDEYRTWQRVAGLYPLTALAFAAGIHRWHEETRRTFAQDLSALPAAGQLVRYAPPARPALTTQEVAEILQRSARNPLRIPEPDAADRERLFAAFAPSFVVDVATEADRIGTPRWTTSDYPIIDTRQPIVYRQLSHARYQDRVLLQLNYIIWFPARPRSGALDLLGGHIDGLTWRVTLTPDGRPWVYDAMHNCGCYHLFFPTARAAMRAQPATLEETAFAPQHAPQPTAPGGLTLRVAHTTHYLQRIMEHPAETAQTMHYQWDDYDSLRALPAPLGARRSLFRSDGIVPGTDRLERILFWPMGIPHPGAMRQWGRHATAFVGRRHFDDPGLLEKNFELEPIR